MWMNEQTVRKTFKYRLKPTPQQEQVMEFTLRCCQELYNAGLEERREAWRKCGVNVTEAGQSAQLPAIKEVRPEYRNVHSQVLQDVLTRLDLAFQRFFARVKTGAKAGYPRFHDAARYNSFTYKQFGNGAALDNSSLVLSKIGRIAVRGQLRGHRRLSLSAGKPTDGMLASPARTFLCALCQQPDK
jgi:putative transposase